METDQLWVKNNPKNPLLTYNYFGQHYLNPRDRNYKEQLEMTYRTMGRTYDWDVEKYRKSGKSADKGNRRRFMKNIARLVKNPYGYLYWKFNRGKPLQVFPTILFTSILGAFYVML